MMTMPEPDRRLTSVTASISAAADAGFTRVWLPQLPPMPGVAPWDALTVLALAGQRSPQVQLATGVVVAYSQHPLALARHALTTAAPMSGRLTLGIGIGHRPMVEALGYSYDKPAAFLREYLEVLLPALAGQAIDHHGQRLTAVGQVAAPGAMAPSVIVAALAPLMLTVAGDLADGTIAAWADPKAFEQHIIPRITKAADAAGRPAPQIIANLPVAVTASPDVARADIAAFYGMAEQAPAYKAILAKGEASGVADVSLVGDEHEVVAWLRRFAEVGVTEFVASPVGDEATRARTIDLLTAA
jgi:F420-dependent oxidoreductase-like protein